MWKHVLAILLGAVSLCLVWGVGELADPEGPTSDARDAVTILTMTVTMGTCFFASQYLLSRGNPEPVRGQWRMVLSLNLVSILFSAGASIFLHSWIVALGLLLITVYGWGCSWAGAAVAGRAARKQDDAA